MHSIRMRTACLLPVTPNMHCARWEWVSAPRGVSAPGECLLLGGVCSQEVSAPGEGVSAPVVVDRILDTRF